MPDDDASRKPRSIEIVPYQPRWADEFAEIARQVRRTVGSAAVRIDHIGSTAVPGLGAKDVVDLQITVRDLDCAAPLTGPLREAGYRQGEEFIYDIFDGMAETDPELRKLYMREPEGRRRTHLHVRELGRFNQRYALLFRDYLRSSDVVRSAYERSKRTAARLFPHDIDGYLTLKDPVFHVIYEAASLWAEKVGWRPDDEFV